MNTNDFKIICIVQNNEKTNSKGLAHVFKHDSIEGLGNICLFIKDFLYHFDENGNFHTNFGYPANDNNKTVFHFLPGNEKCKNNEMEQFAIPEKWDIVLMCDSLDINNNNNKIFFEKLCTSKTLVLFHKKNEDSNYMRNCETIFNELLKSKKLKKYKCGRHESDDNNGYELLSGIFKAWNGANFDIQSYNQAKEKLIKWFGLNEKLKKALEFLHSSLGGTPASTSILTNGDEKFDLSFKYKKDKVEKTLEEWINDLKGNKGDDYYKALAIVRDALLEHAGVTGEN